MLRPTRGFTMDVSAACTDATVRGVNCPVGPPTNCNVDGRPLPYASGDRLFGGGARRFGLTETLSAEIQSDVTFSGEVQYDLPDAQHDPARLRGLDRRRRAVAPGARLAIARLCEEYRRRVLFQLLANGTFTGTVRFVPRGDADKPALSD